jgi:hypothetical protein
MRRFYALFLIGLVATCLISIQATNRISGPPAGATGAPGEATCAQAGCHNGGIVRRRDSLATFDFFYLNNGRYKPNEEITISFRLSKPNAILLGFQACSLDSLGRNAGTFAAQEQSTQTITGPGPNGQRTYIEHTLVGSAANSGRRTWNVLWTAPAPGTGTVTFYAALVVGNTNFQPDGGDSVYVSTFTAPEGPVTSNEVTKSSELKMSHFPNPATDKLTLAFEAPKSETYKLTLLNTAGTVVLQSSFAVTQGIQTKEVNLGQLSAGTYMMHLSHSGGTLVRKVLVQ